MFSPVMVIIFVFLGIVPAEFGCVNRVTKNLVRSIEFYQLNVLFGLTKNLAQMQKQQNYTVQTVGQEPGS